MKNFFTIFGVIALVVGAAIANFTSIPFASYIGIFGEALGLVFTVIGTWKKAEKKTWKEGLTIACFIIAAVCLGIAGVSKDIAVQIATAVAGVVALIASLIINFIPKKEAKK